MKVLLDTHVLLWMFGRSNRLSDTAQTVLSDRENDLLFSIAGYWEVGIKVSIGKLILADGWEKSIPQEMTRNRISWLPIAPPHVFGVSQLPWYHRDPFDRLLIVQAMMEEATILTSDSYFRDYDVSLMW